jgi:hypothetical protein
MSHGSQKAREKRRFQPGAIQPTCRKEGRQPKRTVTLRGHKSANLQNPGDPNKNIRLTFNNLAKSQTEMVDNFPCGLIAYNSLANKKRI